MSRTALVTGANRGIGYAIARVLMGEGMCVVAAGRDGTALAEAFVTLPGFDTSESQTLTMDVGDTASVTAALAKLERNGVSVDVLINNAGVLPDGDLLTMPWEDVASSTQINALGPLLLMRELMPGMAKRGYGRVVNISSGWGSLNSLGPGAYGVSKAFLNAITIKAAREAGRNVLVNAMCPGWVQTRMGGAGADRTPAQAADTALYLATLPNGGPNGGLFRDRRPIPWDE